MDSSQFNNKGRFGEITNEIKLISQDQAAGISTEDIEAHIDAVKAMNDDIITSTIYEESQKTINEIILNTVAADRWDFTSSEWNAIINLANSCPFIYGPAVYEARALANSVDMGLIFDDKIICNSNLRKRNPNSTIEINASIYPNPATNKVTLNTSLIENEKGIFQIFNSLGTKVFSQITNGKTEFDIHALPSGVYSCRLVSGNNDHLIGRLSIVR